MVSALKGVLLTCDIPTKTYLISLNDLLPARWVPLPLVRRTESTGVIDHTGTPSYVPLVRPSRGGRVCPSGENWHER
jgi:hypothetical protein